MSFNKINLVKAPPVKSYAGVASGAHGGYKSSPSKAQKREQQEALDHLESLSKRANVVLGPQYLQFIEKYGLWKNLSHAYPKSALEHGIRLMFNTKFPVELERISEGFESQYPNHTFVEPKYLKGYVDVGFRTAAEADEAAAKPFIIKVSGLDHYVPVTRTRYNQDKCVFIAFERLPTKFSRNEVEGALTEGLQAYGEIVQLVYQKHHLFPKAATSKAIALIKPTSAVNEDISLIPRRANLKIGDTLSEIKVAPESAPPICPLCSCIGHRQVSCPSTVEGLMREDDNAMGEEAEEHRADAIFPWGQTTQYKKVSPVTSQEKKAAAKALQDSKAKAAQETLVVVDDNSTSTVSNYISAMGPNTTLEFTNSEGPNAQTPQTPNSSNQAAETNQSSSGYHPDISLDVLNQDRLQIFQPILVTENFSLNQPRLSTQDLPNQDSPKQSNVSSKISVMKKLTRTEKEAYSTTEPRTRAQKKINDLITDNTMADASLNGKQLA